MDDVVSVDHCGFSVASLDDAIDFWTGALGFELVRTSEMGGDFLRQSTGVSDPCCRMALVRAPGGFTVELLEYSTRATLGRASASAGAIGAAHIALSVADIAAAIDRTGRAGWHARGRPVAIPAGPRAGTIVAYISGPDGITIELMQQTAA